MSGLTYDERNANRGTERGRAALAYSLRAYGAGRAILADRDGRVIAGNKTLAAAEELGLPIRRVRTDGKELVVVLRDDLDLDNDAAARELAYADNRVAELDLAWDLPQLAADLADGAISLDGLWAEGELTTLLAGMGAGEDIPAPTGGAAPDPDLPHATWTLTFPQEAAGIVADTLRELQEGLPELRWKEGS